MQCAIDFASPKMILFFKIIIDLEFQTVQLPLSRWDIPCYTFEKMMNEFEGENSTGEQQSLKQSGRNQNVKRLLFQTMLFSNASKEIFVGLGFRLFLWFLYNTIGVVYYNSVERWDFVTCLYFITESLLGVGYGDVVPTTDNSRIFCAFYNMIGVVLVASTLSKLSGKILIPLQNSLIDKLSVSHSEEERHSKYIIGSFVTIVFAFLMGLWYFSVNTSWTGASTFYFVVNTMLTVGTLFILLSIVFSNLFLGYGDLPVSTERNRYSLLFF